MTTENQKSKLTLFTDLLYQITFWFSAVLMAAMVFIIFIQVIARYMFSSSLSWSEEVGRYLFVMMTFYGGGFGSKAWATCAARFIGESVSLQSTQKIVNIISNVLMLGLVVVVLIGLEAIMGYCKAPGERCNAVAYDLHLYFDVHRDGCHVDFHH